MNSTSQATNGEPLTTEPEVSREEKSTGALPPDGELAQLRQLLLGPERERLDTLQKRLDDPSLRAGELSEVLAEAIHLRSSRDRQLRHSLQPIIEDAIRISVTKNPRVLADALFPMIGAAIRRAVSSALAEMMASLNRTTEKGLSMRSLKWRLEALRTGKSFGEIALLRSLLYRVDEVFLIHRETGLLLLHESTKAGVVKHADLVSGMLTAIQDFVKDSFGTTGDDELEAIQVGEYRVWIQNGPRALIAGVMAGAPPQDLKTVFAETLEDVHRQHRTDLEKFSGDNSPFLPARPKLRACLLGQGQPEKKRQTPWLWLILALAVVLGVGYWAVRGVAEQRRMAAYVGQLNQEAGVVVTSFEKRDGRYRIQGLKDPLSEDPEKILEGSGIDRQLVSFEWRPFHSASPGFVAARELKRQTEVVEGNRLYFDTGSSALPASQLGAADRAATDLGRLFQLAAAAGRPNLRVTIRGSADAKGNTEFNSKLARDRAEEVRTVLAARGVAEERLLLEDVSLGQSPDERQKDMELAFQRSVSFRVIPNP